MQVRSHLLKYQRPEQSGFTPGKSTTDRILALQVLVECCREFQQGMLAAFVDLKRPFDSVHCKALCDLLHLRGIPAGIIGLLSDLYSRTESTVKCGGGRGVSSFFPVHTGVRLGCILAPSLFNTYMDWVLGRVVDQSQQHQDRWSYFCRQCSNLCWVARRSGDGSQSTAQGGEIFGT